MLYALGGLGCGKILSSAEVYDTVEGRWMLLPHMPRSCAHSTAVVARGTLYLLGGYAEQCLCYHSLKTVQQMDLSTERWVVPKPMTAARRNCAAVARKGCIFVLGGLDSQDEPLNTVESLHLSTGCWERLAPMSVARGPCVAVSFSDHVFVLCSRDGSNADEAVERFDFEKQQWE